MGQLWRRLLSENERMGGEFGESKFGAKVSRVCHALFPDDLMRLTSLRARRIDIDCCFKRGKRAGITLNH
jgi:hypothetical protein